MKPETAVVEKRAVRWPFSRVLLFLCLTALAVPFVYPLLWMALSSFKPVNEIFTTPPALFPHRWTLAGYEGAFTINPFARMYVNSLYIATVVTLGTVIVGAMAGYSFARIRAPLSGPAFLLLVSMIFIPGEVTVIPIFRWVSSLGLLDTHWPLIVIPIVARATVPIFIYRQFFLSLPIELEESAKLDGLPRFGIFRKIAFPLAGPATAAVVILTFLGSFNQYFEPLIFLRSREMMTVSLGLTMYQDTYGEPLYNAQLAATTLSVVPVLLVFLFAQRQFVEGLSRTGLKG